MSISIVHLTYISSSGTHTVKKRLPVRYSRPQPGADGKIANLFLQCNMKQTSFTERNGQLYLCPVVGVLDEPYSAKPAQRSSHTGPPGYIGWTLFQPM
jgi:hypothetical protein